MFKVKKNRISLLLAVLAISFCACISVMAAEEEEAPPVPKETIFSLVRKGGAIMIPLGLASVVALALTIERFLTLRKKKIIPANLMGDLMNAWKADLTGAGAIAFCEKSGGAAGHILKAALLRLHKGEDAVEKAIEDAGFREADKMKRSLKGLSVIASVSPLLGLLGTVYGMISAFQTASAVGMGKADILAKGIYEALVTTAAGLTIAIPVLLVYQFLSHRVDAIVDDLDEMGLEFMASCSSEEQA